MLLVIVTLKKKKCFEESENIKPSVSIMFLPCCNGSPELRCCICLPSQGKKNV